MTIRSVALLAVTASLSVAACGDDETTTEEEPAASTSTATDVTAAAPEEGEQSGGASPVNRVGGPRFAIKEVLVAGDASTCDARVTARFVERSYGDIHGCRAAFESDNLARSLTVTELETSEGSATAVVVPHGGTYDGVRVHVALIEDVVWKVDELRANIPAGP